MRDNHERDHAQSVPLGDVWLEVRPDALAWIAGTRASWWVEPDWRTQVRRPNLIQIIADTGMDRPTVYRVAKAAATGARVSLKSDTLAQLIHLGAQQRGVTHATAFARIFTVCDDAQLKEIALRRLGAAA